MVIRRVDPLSAGKIAGLLYAMIGLLFGAVFSVIGMAGATFASEAGDGAPFLGALFGVGAIIVLPIFYGVLGFIAGVIGAALYNLFAAMVGGVVIQTE